MSCSVVSVLESQNVGSLLEFFMFLDPPSSLTTVKIFSSSGQESTYFFISMVTLYFFSLIFVFSLSFVCYSWRRSSFCGSTSKVAAELVFYCGWQAQWCSQITGGPRARFVKPSWIDYSNACFRYLYKSVSPVPLVGIIVDGHLMGAPPKLGVEGRSRTYFDQLTISSPTGGSGDIMITLTLDAVVVEGEGRETLATDQQGWVRRQGVMVTVDNHQSCWIELAKGVSFLVLFHHYKHPSYLQMAHLGFYITDGRGLSESTQGLLGTEPKTFYSQLPVKILQPVVESLLRPLVLVKASI